MIISREEIYYQFLSTVCFDLGVLQSDIKYRNLSKDEIVARIDDIVSKTAKPSNPKV